MFFNSKRKVFILIRKINSWCRRKKSLKSRSHHHQDRLRKCFSRSLSKNFKHIKLLTEVHKNLFNCCSLKCKKNTISNINLFSPIHTISMHLSTTMILLQTTGYCKKECGESQDCNWSSPMKRYWHSKKMSSSWYSNSWVQMSCREETSWTCLYQ